MESRVYYDIHSHILPGVDDGAKDIEMSMQMAEAAYAQGVRVMIATPHFYPGHRSCMGEELVRVYRETSEHITERFEDFRFLLGNEIYYKDEVIGLLKEGKLQTMAGTRYVLLEFSVTADYKALYHAVYRCVNAGFWPIIAHVERYRCLFGQEEKLEELIRAGAYIQVNAENFGKGLINPARRRVTGMIRDGYVHFLASDCHNMQARKPNVKPAADYLLDKVDSRICESILRKNPELLLQDKCIG